MVRYSKSPTRKKIVRVWQKKEATKAKNMEKKNLGPTGVRTQDTGSDFASKTRVWAELLVELSEDGE